MARRTVDTGIYRQESMEINQDSTPEEIAEFRAEFKADCAEEESIYTILDHLEQVTAKVLGRPDGSVRIAKQREAYQRAKGEAKLAVWYAKLARGHLAANNAPAAAWAAFNAAVHFERMFVRPHEPYVKQVRETTSKLKAGHRASKQKPDAVAQAVAYYHELMKKPGKKKCRAEAEASKRFGVPVRTIQRHKNLKS